MRSPTEFESTPVITHVLQEYFLRLLGRYREHIQPEGTPRQPAPASEDHSHAGPSLQRISLSGLSGDIRARPSFRQSPKAAGAVNRGAADDDGYLRCALHILACCIETYHVCHSCASVFTLIQRVKGRCMFVSYVEKCIAPLTSTDTIINRAVAEHHTPNAHVDCTVHLSWFLPHLFLNLKI